MLHSIQLVHMNLSIHISSASLDQFESEFSCEINTLPRNVALVGWSAKQHCWKIAPEGVSQHPVFKCRAPSTLLFFQNTLLPRLGPSSFWTLYCFDDGWRERNTYSKNYRWVHPPKQEGMNEWRGEPGEIPMLRCLASLEARTVTIMEMRGVVMESFGKADAGRCMECQMETTV
jgi:hypothetical protein